MLPRTLAWIALDRMQSAGRLAENFAQGLDACGRHTKVALPVALQPAPAAGLRHDRRRDEGQHLVRSRLQTDRKAPKTAIAARMRGGIGTFASQVAQGLAYIGRGLAAAVPGSSCSSTWPLGA
jgi:hypothetical protein